MFSLTSSKSFIELGYTINAVLFTKKEQEVPMVVVGNKADNRDDRAVSAQMGSQLADVCKSEYIEVAALGNC